jgi:hypothetical protein
VILISLVGFFSLFFSFLTIESKYGDDEIMGLCIGICDEDANKRQRIESSEAKLYND